MLEQTVQVLDPERVQEFHSTLHGALIQDGLRPVVTGRGGNQMLEEGGLARTAVPYQHDVADLAGVVSQRAG